MTHWWFPDPQFENVACLKTLSLTLSHHNTFRRKSKTLPWLPINCELPHMKGRNWKSSRPQTPWLPAGSIRYVFWSFRMTSKYLKQWDSFLDPHITSCTLFAQKQHYYSVNPLNGRSGIQNHHGCHRYQGKVPTVFSAHQWRWPTWE